MAVHVEKCRYLEASACAGVCINNCKIPTQEFFSRHMGLPLTMTPDYATQSCTFAFSVPSPPVGEEAAFATPCLEGCPSGRACDVCPSVASAVGVDM